MSAIVDVIAREILDSRGNPTVEAGGLLEAGGRGRGGGPLSSAAARATAIDTARIAFAPRRDLFSVPSSLMSIWSRSDWSMTDKPLMAGPT